MTEVGVAIADLRRLILEAAPDRAQAEPVLSCADDVLLDSVIPFSSVIVLGVVVAVEDAYGIRITKQMLQRTLEGGATLRKLATMIDQERSA